MQASQKRCLSQNQSLRQKEDHDEKQHMKHQQNVKQRTQISAPSLTSQPSLKDKETNKREGQLSQQILALNRRQNLRQLFPRLEPDQHHLINELQNIQINAHMSQLMIQNRLPSERMAQNMNYHEFYNIVAQNIQYHRIEDIIDGAISSQKSQHHHHHHQELENITNYHQPFLSLAQNLETQVENLQFSRAISNIQKKSFINNIQGSNSLLTQNEFDRCQFKIIKLYKWSQNMSKSLCLHFKTGVKYDCIQYTVKDMSERSKSQLQDEISRYKRIKNSSLPELKKGWFKKHINSVKITFFTKYREGEMLSRCIFQLSLKELLQAQENIIQALVQLQKAGLCHNNINADSCIYSDIKGVMLGLPTFPSIERAIRKQNQFDSYVHSVYSSPQMRLGERGSIASDLWATGMLLLKQYFNQNEQQIKPQSNDHQKLSRLIEQIEQTYIKDSIKKMLHPEKQDRIRLFQQSLYTNIEHQQENSSLQVILRIKLIQHKQERNGFRINRQVKKVKRKGQELTYWHRIQINNNIRLFIIFSNNRIDITISSPRAEVYCQITKDSLPSSLRNYFGDMASIYNHLIASMIIVEGEWLSFNYDQEQILKMRQSIFKEERANNMQKTLFPTICAGTISNSHYYHSSRGVMIASNTMLTTATAVYDRTAKRTNTDIAVTLPHSRNPSIRNMRIVGCLTWFPPQFARCSDADSSKYDYAIITLPREKTVNPCEYINLGVDFCVESLSLNRRSLNQEPPNFHYLMNGITLAKDEVYIHRGRAYCSHFVGEESGSVLFVVFESGRTLGIGILQGSGSVLLISAKMIEDFYAAIDNAKQSANWRQFQNGDEQLLMAFPSPHIDAQQQESKLTEQSYTLSPFFQLRTHKLKVRALLQAEQYMWAAVEYLYQAPRTAQKDHQQRVTLLKKAAVLTEWAQGSNSSYLINIYGVIGGLLYSIQRYTDARCFYSRALQLEAGFICSPYSKAIFCRFLGLISSNLGQSASVWEKHYRSAAEEFTKLSLGKHSIYIFANLSVDYFNAGMRREAADSSLKAFSLLEKYQTNETIFRFRQIAFQILLRCGRFLCAAESLLRPFQVANQKGWNNPPTNPTLHAHIMGLFRILLSFLYNQSAISERVLFLVQDYSLRFGRGQMQGEIDPLYAKPRTRP